MSATCFKLHVLLAGCCLGCAVQMAAGQNSVTVTAFQTSGQLTFSAPMGSRCAIEWASHPTSQWSRTWSSLDSLRIMAPTTMVKVPMFYRVVCWSNAPSFLILPFEGLADMGPIHESYSETTNCPWGFEHSGIDFFPTADLKAFVAVASGTVSLVQLFQDGNWVVDVSVVHDGNYLSGYSFEPMSSSVLHGSNQLANIVVTASQAVAQGEIIGYLYAPSNGAHVHYQFMTTGGPTCPEPYFDDTAVTSILYLLDMQWPDAAMCY